jgi:probable F420-dependent oxidoreductase
VTRRRRSRRIGIMLWPSPGRDAGFERALWCEDRGFDDVWFPDGEGMQDALTLAAGVATRTARVRLCTGIVPVYNRPPAVLATSALALSHLAPGRFVLGIGSSTHAMVENWYGRRFEKPLAHVRETTELLRRLFAGEKTDFQGEVLRSRGFRLKEMPAASVPIHIAAMGPKMLALAGEVGDGVVLNDMTPDDRIPEALEQIDRGAKRSGRRVEDLEISIRRAVIVSRDEGAARELFRSQFTFYGSTPVYQKQMVLLGYKDQIEEIRAGYATRDRQRSLAAVDDAMLERFYVFGDDDACRARIRASYEAGIDSVFVSPQAGDAAGFETTCEAFAPAVFSAAGSGRST